MSCLKGTIFIFTTSREIKKCLYFIFNGKNNHDVLLTEKNNHPTMENYIAPRE
jgi:hypothetical protein